MASLLSPSINLSSPNTFTTEKQLGSNNIAYDEKPSVEVTESNGDVKRAKYVLKNKKWHQSMMVIRTIGMIVVHGLAMLGPFYFDWGAFWVAVVLYGLTGVCGITLSFHRNLSHKSFTLPKGLEYMFAYFGSLAFQDDPIEWVRTHRYHHKFVDTERDPHSPMEGFWHSHMIWILDTASLAEKRGISGITRDMETQPFYMFMRRTYMLHQFALGYLLYVFGGFSYVVWGMGVRIVCLFHAIFCVNSVCHIWGKRVWNTTDLSKNNLWVALVSGGEGWHNNHHAFGYSARHGLEWWQIDMTWYVIKLLEVVGLAKDVKLPTEAHKQRLTIKTDGTKTD